MIYHAGGPDSCIQAGKKRMKNGLKKAPACVVLIRKEDGSLYMEWRPMRLPEGTRLIRFTNEEFTQLTTYMSSQYGIDLSKKKILAECRMNGELEKRGNISMGEYMRQMAEDRTKQL